MNTTIENDIPVSQVGAIIDKYEDFKKANPALKEWEIIGAFVKNLCSNDPNETDWYCPNCDAYLVPQQVTFEETHVLCGTRVS